MSAGRVLICVRGFGLERLLDRATQLLPDGMDWTIVHVVDRQPEAEFDRALAGLPGRRTLHGHAGDDRVHRSVDQLQRDVRADLEAWLTTRNRDAELAFLYGVPEQEIVDLAAELDVDIVVVGARAEIGPHRFSRVSRFVVDHAPCSVLVIAPD